MKAVLNKISRHPSKFGGDFYYLFFKTEKGESCKSCVGPAYRNWSNWAEIVKNFDEAHPILLENLIYRNGLIDADSKPQKVKEE